MWIVSSPLCKQFTARTFLEGGSGHFPFAPLPCFLALIWSPWWGLSILSGVPVSVSSQSPGRTLLMSSRVHKTMINSNSKLYYVSSTSYVLYMYITFILITQRGRYYYPTPGNWGTRSNLLKTSEQVGRRVGIQTQLVWLHIPAILHI